MCQSLSQNLLLSFRISGVCVCVRVCVACACISWTCRFVDEAITLKQKKKDLAEEKVDLQLLWCRREIEKKCTFFEKKINNGAANTLHSAGNVQVRDLYIDIHIVQDTYIHTPRQKREQIQETSSAPCYRSGYRQEYWLLTIWQDLCPSNSFRRLQGSSTTYGLDALVWRWVAATMRGQKKRQ